jgi:hypothetical protein
MSDTGWVCLMVAVVMGTAIVAATIDQKGRNDCRVAVAQALNTSSAPAELIAQICK